METLWQEFKDRDVVLLGVNIDEPESVVEDFVNEFSLTYPVLLGNTSLKNIYNIGGRHISPYPRDYIVGTDGRIAYASAEFDPEQITNVVLSQLNPAPAIDPAKSDFNSDGLVDFGDFLMFAAGFGGSDPALDIDEDGSVGFGDFLIFAQAFGSATRN
jgi:hypothetical protein